MHADKDTALRLLEANRTAAEVAKQLDKSLRTIQRWAAEFKSKGNQLPRKRGGQPKLTAAQEADLVGQMKDGPAANGLAAEYPRHWKLYDAANFIYRQYDVWYAPNHLRDWLEAHEVPTIKDGSRMPPSEPYFIKPDYLSPGSPGRQD